MHKPTRWERQRFWQGQLLRSRDFNDQFRQEAQLRWWHNRALHDVYGVAAGLETSVQTTDALGRVTRVAVQPGLAYDCYGRELVLNRPWQGDVPDALAPAGLTLLAHYPQGDLPPRRNDSACPPDESQAAPDTIGFSWKRSDRVSFRDGVPLYTLTRQGQEDAAFQPPSTRALARPHLASGSTVAGNTHWAWWELDAGSEQSLVLGLEVEVDTSGAGFTQTPCYFAWLPRFWEYNAAPLYRQEAAYAVAVEGAAARAPDPALLFSLLVDRHGHIYDATATRFTFRLWLPALSSRARLPRTAAFANALLAHAQRFPVCWVAIQTS